jgi:hypothetical protein
MRERGRKGEREKGRKGERVKEKVFLHLLFKSN